MASVDPTIFSVGGSHPQTVHATLPPSQWKKLLAVVKVIEMRLRFVALMAVTGLVFGNWDAIWNHYEKWQRPAEMRPEATGAIEFFCPMHPGIVRDEPCGCPSCGMPLSRRNGAGPTHFPRGFYRVCGSRKTKYPWLAYVPSRWHTPRSLRPSRQSAKWRAPRRG
jgi:hypothetical protein